MHKQIRGIVTVALLLSPLSTLAVAPKALAETATVNFTANVTPLCIFSNTVPGTLVLESTGLGLTSFPNAGGIAAQTRLSCNSSVTVRVGAPANNGSTFNIGSLVSDRYSTVQSTAGLAFFFNGTTQTRTIQKNSTTQIVDQTLTVNMQLRTRSLVPAGTYNYTVPVTATPL